MKKESQKNKITLPFMLIIFIGLLQSCFDNNRNMQEQKNNSDSIVSIDSSRIDSSVHSRIKIDLDSIKNTKNTVHPIPDYYDYESVYQLEYEFYINKAYSRKTYEKYYKVGAYQSNHLDSLIDIYEKKKENSE